MDSNLDCLKRFIDNINHIGFWGRLFNWQSIKNQLPGAAADLQKLISNHEMLKNAASKSEGQASILSNNVQLLNERKNELDIELAGLRKELQHIRAELADVKKQNAQLIGFEDVRKTEHSNS